MTKEELLKKIDFEKNWLYECGIFGSDVDIAFHAIKKSVIETLEQEPCEDCISRQAVKSILGDRYIELQKRHDDKRLETNYCLNTILELPSINPQKIGHCKDCKYFEYDSLAKVDGVKLIFAHEICKRWGDGCKTSEEGFCFLFEPQESEE